MAVVLFSLDQQFFPTPWTLRDWEQTAEQDYLLSLIESQNEILGFCLFQKSVGDSFAHLLKIVIRNDDRKKGLGRKLLEESLAQLVKLGCTQMFLEVEENNFAAQKLYLSMGFKTIHRKSDFYGNGRAALIMTR